MNTYYKYKTYPDLYRICNCCPLGRGFGGKTIWYYGNQPEPWCDDSQLHHHHHTSSGKYLHALGHKGRLGEPLAAAQLQAWLALLPCSLASATPGDYCGRWALLPAISPILRHQSQPGEDSFCNRSIVGRATLVSLSDIIRPDHVPCDDYLTVSPPWARNLAGGLTCFKS